MSLFDDIDLGYYLDDYIGFDSTRRMGVCYNATNDDGATGGHPANSYGLKPPQSAITMIVLPGDVGTTYVPVGNFVYFNNDFSVIGNPTHDTQFNYYMRGRLKNGVHFHNDFTGPGSPSTGMGPGPDCNYVFPMDPSNNTGWSECATNNNPGDRRFIISSNDFTLNAGSSQKVVLGLVVADTVGGCGSTNFNEIKAVADTAWHNYFNPPSPLPPNLTNNVTKSVTNIYPNPAANKLFVEDDKYGTITIYNTLGQVCIAGISKTGKKCEIDISSLPAGCYYVLYKNNDSQVSSMFVKQ